MKIWKFFSVFAMSMLLVAMLAACGGGSSTDSAASTPTTAVPTSAPTTAAPTSAPATGGCTTAASCQKAVVSVTPNQVKPGGKVMVTVKGWVANAKLTVTAGYQIEDSDRIVTTSDAQGNFSVTLTIRTDTPDVGPTGIIVTLENDTTDGSKNLKVPDKLTIIK